MSTKTPAPKPSQQDVTSTPAVSNPETTKKVHVEETPIGMSAAQMKLSSSDSVAELQNEAITEDRERLGELKAAFPDDLEYATEAHTKGFTVAEAKAERFDAVQEENKTLKAENETLKKDVDESAQVTFTSSDDETPSADAGDVDHVEATGIAIWNKDAELRAEFDTKSAFLAYYKNHPHEFKTK